MSSEHTAHREKPIDPNTLSLKEFAEHLRQGDLVERLLKLAHDEDLGPEGRDWTGQLMFKPDSTRKVQLNTREAGVLAGTAFIPDLLRVFCPNGDVECRTYIGDGARIEVGACIASLKGNARSIVKLERTMLNLLSRMCGIATRVHSFVELVKQTNTKICDTRKTTPGLRVFEKYAVRCGGGHTHRMGLYDAVLIKDNHIAGLSSDQLATSLRHTAYELLESGARLQFVQVEVDTLEQLQAVLTAGSGIVEIILLDNMAPDVLAEAVALRDQQGSSVLLEASGGVTEKTVTAIAQTGVDRISIGGLTHQAQSLDLGLDAVS